MKIFNRKIFNEERFYEFINELVELRGESDEIIKNEIYNKTIINKFEDKYLFTVTLNETLDLINDKQLFQFISNHEMKIKYMYLKDVKKLINKKKYKHVFLVDEFLDRKLLVYTSYLYNTFNQIILFNDLYKPENDDCYDYYEITDLISKEIKKEQNKKQLNNKEYNKNENINKIITRIVNQVIDQPIDNYSNKEIALYLFDFYLEDELNQFDFEQIDYKVLELTGDNSIQNINKLKKFYLKKCEEHAINAQYLNDQIKDLTILNERLDDIIKDYVIYCQKSFFYSKVYTVLDQLYLNKLRGGLDLK